MLPDRGHRQAGVRQVRRLILAIAVIGVLASAALWLLSGPRPAVSAADFAALEVAGDRDRGKLIFDAADCS